MIRHIVLVRFNTATAASEQDAIFADLAALGALLPGLGGFSHGPDVSPESLARGFTHAFTIDFADAAARDAYLVHPAHQAAGARLVAAAAGGLDGLVVIDIPL